MTIAPMLLGDATEAQLEHLLTSDDWVAQQKVDGDHLLVTYDGAVRFFNRAGDQTTPEGKGVARMLADCFLPLDFDFAVDGELVVRDKWLSTQHRVELHLFDMPYGPIREGSNIPNDMRRPFHVRSAALQTLASALGPSARAIPVAEGTEQKWNLFRWLGACGGEGVVFRHRDAKYEPGKRSKGALRWKFVKDVDAVVFDLAPKGDRACVSVGCFDDNMELVQVADVSRHGKATINLQDVCTVKCLYATPELKLVQPRFSRIGRTDKKLTECSLEQVRSIITNPEVLTAVPTGEPPARTPQLPRRKSTRST